MTNRKQCVTCSSKIYYSTFGDVICKNCQRLTEIPVEKFKIEFKPFFREKLVLLSNLIKKFDSEFSNGFTIHKILIAREEAAKKIIENPYDSLDKTEEWLAYTLSLMSLNKANYHFSIVKSNSTLNDECNEQVRKVCLQIFDLLRGYHLVIEDEDNVWKIYKSDKEIFFLTTDKPSKTIYTEFKEWLLKDKTVFREPFDSKGFPDTEIFFVTSENPKKNYLHHSLIIAKLFSRINWRFKYNDLTPKQIDKLDYYYTQLVFNVFKDDNYIIVRKSFATVYKMAFLPTISQIFPLDNTYSKYFLPLVLNDNYIFGSYSFEITRYFYYSLQSSFKITQLIGSEVEHSLYYTLGALDLQRYLPNGQKGLRVPYPNNPKKELADILVHKRKTNYNRIKTLDCI